MYGVKELADLAGVSRRTLHYYDEKALLKPTRIAENGYRSYDDHALLRLQQILFYREIGFELSQIRDFLDEPEFDALSALRSHRGILQARIDRLGTLINTVDTTIMHLVGELDMSDKNIFKGFSDSQQAQYEKEAVDNWGDNAAKSIKLWKSYPEEKKAEILAEGQAIYAELAAKMALGPEHSEIRALLVRWHEHLRYFYEPSIELLGGLGEMYHDHADFNATFTKIDPDLPAFLKAAIGIYVDELETAWLERELGILEE
jgi:DNA-binding transcriptional MerR regulator